MKTIMQKKVSPKKAEPTMLEKLTEQIRRDREAEEAAREAQKSIQKALDGVEKLLAELADSAKKLELLDKLDDLAEKIAEAIPVREQANTADVREWQFDIKRGSYGEIVKVTATPIP